MVAQVDVDPLAQREKPADLDPRILQEPARRGARVFLPQAVDQHPDLDPPVGRALQGIRETAPRLVTVEDVGAQVHRMAGPGDRRQHGGIGVLPVFQRDDPVAGEKGEIADPVAQPVQLGQMLFPAGRAITVSSPRRSGKLAQPDRRRPLSSHWRARR